MPLPRIIFGLLAVFALANAVRAFNRSRTAPYFLLRRAAAMRGWRWLLGAVGAGLAFGATYWVRLPQIELPARPAPPTSTLVIEITPAPTRAATSSPQPPGTPTSAPEEQSGQAPPLASRVPSPTPAPLFATLDTTVTPQAGAAIDITAVSTEITDDFLPANASSALEAGTSRFYVFYDYRGMSEGVSWSGVVLVDNQIDEDVGFNELWATGEEGTNLYRWFDREGGWPLGEYEVRLYIGDQLADSITFRMVERDGPSEQDESGEDVAA